MKDRKGVARMYGMWVTLNRTKISNGKESKGK